MGNLGITSGEEIRAFLRALRAGGAPLRVLDVHSNPLCSALPAPYAGTHEPTKPNPNPTPNPKPNPSPSPSPRRRPNPGPARAGSRCDSCCMAHASSCRWWCACQPQPQPQLQPQPHSNPKQEEHCAVVARVARSFLRFGSFEVRLPAPPEPEP